MLILMWCKHSGLCFAISSYNPCYNVCLCHSVSQGWGGVNVVFTPPHYSFWSIFNKNRLFVKKTLKAMQIYVDIVIFKFLYLYKNIKIKGLRLW